jgi:hypothetical protein
MDQDIVKINEWLEATNAPLSRLGLLACANPHAVHRIRNGTASMNTYKAVMAYIEKNPPVK